MPSVTIAVAGAEDEGVCNMMDATQCSGQFCSGLERRTFNPSTPVKRRINDSKKDPGDTVTRG